MGEIIFRKGRPYMVRWITLPSQSDINFRQLPEYSKLKVPPQFDTTSVIVSSNVESLFPEYEAPEAPKALAASMRWVVSLLSLEGR